MIHKIINHTEARSGYANPDSALDSEKVELKKRLIVAFENFTRELEGMWNEAHPSGTTSPGTTDAGKHAMQHLMEANFWAKQSLR